MATRAAHRRQALPYCCAIEARRIARQPGHGGTGVAGHSVRATADCAGDRPSLRRGRCSGWMSLATTDRNQRDQPHLLQKSQQIYFASPACSSTNSSGTRREAMVGILIIAHASYGAALVSSASHVLGHAGAGAAPWYDSADPDNAAQGRNGASSTRRGVLICRHPGRTPAYRDPARRPGRVGRRSGEPAHAGAHPYLSSRAARHRGQR
jgi:hypothetical protein